MHNLVVQCLLLVYTLGAVPAQEADSSPQQFIKEIEQAFDDGKRQDSLPVDQKLMQ